RTWWRNRIASASFSVLCLSSSCSGAPTSSRPSTTARSTLGRGVYPLVQPLGSWLQLHRSS
ncbi:unnamed protein product, partial [Symbiodinium pilosum]